MVACTRELAEMRRKERGINAKMGYFKDAGCTQFWEGEYLTNVRK
jgi:hypothetical protein